MSEFPESFKYTKEHEWILLDGEKAKVGITDFAQSELGEIVFVEMPELGSEIAAGATACVVESTKAASDVYSPISGRILNVNPELENQPRLINDDPHNQGWLFTLENVNSEELASLMTASEYKEFINQ